MKTFYDAQRASRITHLVFLQSSGVSIAVEREEVCGDRGKFLRAMVTDGLSHGPFAERAAREAAAVFRSQATTGAASTLNPMIRLFLEPLSAAGPLWSFVQRKARYSSRRWQPLDAHLEQWPNKSFG
jgi:hypothetical protein